MLLSFSVAGNDVKNIITNSVRIKINKNINSRENMYSRVRCDDLEHLEYIEHTLNTLNKLENNLKTLKTLKTLNSLTP